MLPVGAALPWPEELTVDENAGDAAEHDRRPREQPAPMPSLVLPGDSQLTIYDVARVAGVAPVDRVPSVVEARPSQLRHC